MLKCPNCYKQEIVKNGKVHGNQRYLCKKCGYTFTQFRKKEYSLGRRQTFVKHYLRGESLRSLEKGLDYQGRKKPTNVTILYWIKKLDELITNPDTIGKEYDFDFQDKKRLDEMCAFLNGRSIRKLKKIERQRLTCYLYIILKLLKKVPQKKKRVKAENTIRTTYTNSEEEVFEKIFQHFVTEKSKKKE